MGVWLGVSVADVVPLGVREELGVDVEDGVCEPEALDVGEGVAVGLGVSVPDAVRVALGVPVPDADAVPVITWLRDGDAVASALCDCVCEAVAVWLRVLDPETEREPLGVSDADPVVV